MSFILNVMWQSNFGTVSLQYQLSDQPLFGEWVVRVEALGQVEESQFLVEEYYQTRFEVGLALIFERNFIFCCVKLQLRLILSINIVLEETLYLFHTIVNKNKINL